MEAWAEQEVGRAEFGDKRLTKRLVKMVEDLAAKPEASIPQACGSWAATKAAYRFWSDEKVTAKAIRAVHQERTRERVEEHEMILAVQDTTSLNYAAHLATTGLGPIDSHGSSGCHVHSVLAVSPDGVPCGLLHQQVWSRDPQEQGKKKQRKKKQIEEKESYRWIESVEKTEKALSTKTHIVIVADREADIFELFALPRPEHVDLLIRATQDRWARTEDDQMKKLWESVEEIPASTDVVNAMIEHKPGMAARTVDLTLRWRTITLLPPRGKKKRYAPVTLTAVLAQEIAPPEGAKPLTWLVLTTLPVETFAQAAQCVHWYRFRWLIERYHFVLKSGCHLEKIQLETADRLEKALATYCLVAWRLLWLTYQARQAPEAACEPILQEYEWKALYAFYHKTNVLPSVPPPLRDVVRWIAQLGGFLGRASDGEPGVQTIWRGLRRLDDISSMWLLLLNSSAQSPPLSSG